MLYGDLTNLIFPGEGKNLFMSSWRLDHLVHPWLIFESIIFGPRIVSSFSEIVLVQKQECNFTLQAPSYLHRHHMSSIVETTVGSHVDEIFDFLANIFPFIFSCFLLTIFIFNTSFLDVLLFNPFLFVFLWGNLSSRLRHWVLTLLVIFLNFSVSTDMVWCAR